jgi:hypothetical protein
MKETRKAGGSLPSVLSAKSAKSANSNEPEKPQPKQPNKQEIAWKKCRELEWRNLDIKILWTLDHHIILRRKLDDALLLSKSPPVDAIVFLQGVWDGAIHNYSEWKARFELKKSYVYMGHEVPLYLEGVETGRELRKLRSPAYREFQEEKHAKSPIKDQK